jgi:hypothetical protein
MSDPNLLEALKTLRGIFATKEYPTKITEKLRPVEFKP